jgi:hypothetical protein
MDDRETTPSAARAYVPGEGNIRERTIRFGNVILAVANIDSVALAMRPRNLSAFLFGSMAVGALVAAIVHAMVADYRASGAVFAAVIAIGAGIAWLRPLDNLLAVGVAGGRNYYVRSKDKEFLIRLGELIRRKIDSDDPSLTADFSDARDEITVGVARAPPR